MKTLAKQMVRRALNLAGLEIRRYMPPQPSFMRQVLDLYEVDTIFDVGANIGQSGQQFRDAGFPFQIVSFEPVLSLFEALQVAASKDALWHVENVALGDFAGQVQINVSGGHAGASSILEMTQNVLENAPDQQVVRKEKIEVKTLDAMMEKYYPEGDRCFLKLDVQGYERKLLKGGLGSIDRIVGLKIEMSLVENYEGETLLSEMLPYLYGLGFRLVYFENGWSNNVSRELYQVDGVFFRTGVALALPDATLPPTA